MKNFFRLLLVLLAISLSTNISAQRKRNYVYLFDCTQSMQETFDIWQPAKNALADAIKRLASQEGSRFVVIPFQGQAYQPIIFSGNQYPALTDSIEATFNRYILKRTNTNILDAINAAISNCDQAMENRIYLITDGADNVHKMPAVCRRINEWCANHKNTRFFYVALTDAAYSPELQKAIDACSDAYIINSMMPTIVDIDRQIFVSTLDLDKLHAVRFSDPGRYPLSIRSSDPLFDVELVGGAAQDLRFILRITPAAGRSLSELNQLLTQQAGPDGNYSFNVEVSSPDQATWIANPNLKIIVVNHPQRKLTLGGGKSIDGRLPDASWYPAFLFSDEKAPDTLSIDLRPQWNDAAIAAGSRIRYAIQLPQEQKPDFTLALNGRPVDTADELSLEAGQPAILSLIFNRQANTGNRSIRLVPVDAENLELINELPAEEAEEIALESHYSVNWNPLKTILFWIAVAIAALLLIWFCLIKPIKFPSMPAATLQLAGPGSFFINKPIKGARSVVLISPASRMKQGIISRIFTGRIIFIRGDQFTTPAEFQAGRKNSIRLKSTKDWTMVPSRTLKKAPGQQGPNQLIATRDGSSTNVSLM